MAGRPGSDILVASRDAGDYVRLLAEHGIRAAAANSTESALSAYSGQAIVLGEPGILAVALPSMPGVRWVQSTWAGVTPLVEAARAGVTVTGVKDVFGPQMAEYVLGYLLAHELQVIRRYRWQQESRWVQQPTGRLAGKTLGVLGTGSIGRVVAERAVAFGMRALGCSLRGEPLAPFERVWPAGQLHEFLGHCDHVVGLLPDTPGTHGLLDKSALAAMRPGSVLVNAGRGSLVDEQALVQALESGHLGGAVLDVFGSEPLPENHPFWHTPGLRVTAHVSAWSVPADIIAVFLDNLARFRNGAPLQYVLDPQRGY